MSVFLSFASAEFVLFLFIVFLVLNFLNLVPRSKFPIITGTFTGANVDRCDSSGTQSTTLSKRWAI